MIRCRPLLAWVCAFSALALAGCKKSAASLCTSDVHCAQGFVCDDATGACRCASDSSCAAAEQCNADGFCQPRLKCAKSSDCAADSICDTPSGACIPSATCTIDVQCGQGQVCDTGSFTCVPGCRAKGDCPLGEVCRPCPAGTPRDQCPTGQACVLGPCDDQTACPFGDYCLPDSSGDKVCSPDPQNRPFCKNCVGSPGLATRCAGFANYCLIDTSKPLGQAFYCGVDCSERGQIECPNGYQCRDVRIVTAQNCDQSKGLSACPAGSVVCNPAKNHAPGGGLPGIVNDDCDAAGLVGAVCDPNTSHCAPQCTGTGEAGVEAFCSCIKDDDCPQDACDSSTRACQISGKPCIVGQVPDDCQSTNKIFCVKVSDPRLGPIGYCRIGQNCAPAEGYTCDALRGVAP